MATTSLVKVDLPQSKLLSVTINVADERVLRRLNQNITAVPNEVVLQRIYLFVNTITVLGGKVTHPFWKNFKYVNMLRFTDYTSNGIRVALGIKDTEEHKQIRNKIKIVKLPIQLFDKNISDRKIQCLAFKFVDKNNY